MGPAGRDLCGESARRPPPPNRLAVPVSVSAGPRDGAGARTHLLPLVGCRAAGGRAAFGQVVAEASALTPPPPRCGGAASRGRNGGLCALCPFSRDQRVRHLLADWPWGFAFSGRRIFEAGFAAAGAQRPVCPTQDA